jgi:hypothetical protein
MLLVGWRPSTTSALPAAGGRLPRPAHAGRPAGHADGARQAHGLVAAGVDAGTDAVRLAWGFVGLLLAVPLLVCIKLVLARLDGMQGWARLLE